MNLFVLDQRLLVEFTGLGDCVFNLQKEILQKSVPGKYSSYFALYTK